MSQAKDRLLRYSLRGNAAFSSLSGLAALIFATPLASALGTGPPLALRLLGAQLFGFALLLVWLAARPLIRPAFVWAVIAADLLWVVGTVPIVMSGELSSAGNWTAGMIADVVALFALLQYLGVRRLQPQPAAAAA